MSTLTIRKKSLKTWLHTDSVLGDFIISKFYFNADNVSFQIVEQGQSRRVIYNIADITLYALASGGTAETFANITALSLRLEELNYPAFQLDGQITSIANLLEGGDGVEITGDGTEASPYIINLTSGDALFLGSFNSLVALQTAHPVALNGSYAFVSQTGADIVYFFSTDDNNWWTVSGGVTSVNTKTGAVVLNQDEILDGTNYKQYSLTEKNKLAGIADGAEVNVNADWNATSGDAQILNKPTITTPNLQEVTDEGNETTNDVIVKDTENKLFLRPRSIQFQDIDQEGSTTLRFEDTDVADQEVFIRGLGGTMALTSDIPTNTSDLTNDGADGVNPFITALDIPTYTTPSIQEVLTDGGDTAEDSAIYFTNTANDFETTINQYGDGQILFSSVINDAGTSVGAGSIYLGNLSGSGAFITKDKITVNTIDYPFPSGASSPLATLADITGGGGGGIAHATASGTDTYTATITGVAAYSDADAYLIRFTNGNTTGATLNINALGAKTLYRNNDGALIGGDIINGGEMLCIYNTSLNGFQVIGTAPNSLFAYVTNADSVTITKGMPVYAFSGQGDRMTVKRANNSTDATSAQTVGLVLSTSIAAGQKGLIMMQGLLDGLSILPTATFADGDAVYLGSTAGTITNVKPYAPNHLVYLGVVTTASNGSAGRMYVRVQNGYELSEIHDIDLITNAPTNNQALVYESSSDLWKNKTIIEDSITNGVTTIAPSQNAVFDALALKQAVLAYSPYRNVQTSQTPHTGTTAETNIFTATIPAGAFNANDVIKVLFGANKTTALAGYTLRIRVSATNNPTAATLIANYAQAGTNAQTVTIMRNYNLNGGNLYGFSFSTSSLTDIVAQGGAISSTAVNPANQFFIFANIVLANAGDSIIGNMFSIHN